MWQAHRARMQAAIRRLRIGRPRSGLARRDPYGLRGVLVVALAVGVFVAGGDWRARIDARLPSRFFAVRPARASEPRYLDLAAAIHRPAAAIPVPAARTGAGRGSHRQHRAGPAAWRRRRARTAHRPRRFGDEPRRSKQLQGRSRHRRGFDPRHRAGLPHAGRLADPCRARPSADDRIRQAAARPARGEPCASNTAPRTITASRASSFWSAARTIRRAGR